MPFTIKKCKQIFKLFLTCQTQWYEICYRIGVV